LAEAEFDPDSRSDYATASVSRHHQILRYPLKHPEYDEPQTFGELTFFMAQQANTGKSVVTATTTKSPTTCGTHPPSRRSRVGELDHRSEGVAAPNVSRYVLPPGRVSVKKESPGRKTRTSPSLACTSTAPINMMLSCRLGEGC